jgi:cytochrome P450
MGTYNARRFFLAAWLERWHLVLVVRVYRFLDDRPTLMCGVMRLLRLKPVWYFGRTVVATGDRQVREVLARDDDFPLPVARNEKFLTGTFILGMSRTPQYVKERAELEQAVLRTDVARVTELARSESRRLVEQARQTGTGTIDAVQGLANPLGETFLAQYFGVSTHHAIADQLRLLGAMIGSPRAELPEFRAKAFEAAATLFRSLQGDVQSAAVAVKGTREPPDTVLQRLVNAGLGRAGFAAWDPEEVRRNMTGVLLPGSALVTRAFAIGLVQLFKRPTLLNAARNARGDQAVLQLCILEALRFHPVFPLLPRFSPRETQLPGRLRPYRVPAGNAVHALVAAALVDPASPLFAGADGGHPAEARLRDDPSLYLHFGGGAHKCLAIFIALPQLAAMLEAVLTLPVVSLGRIVYHEDDSITPERLQIRFSR